MPPRTGLIRFVLWGRLPWPDDCTSPESVMSQVTHAFCSSAAHCVTSAASQGSSVAVGWARIFVILASGALYFGGSWSAASADPPILNDSGNPSTASSSRPERIADSAKPSAGPARSKRVFSATEQDTLIGLEGVHVIVEDLSEDAIAVGLSRDSLRTAVELRLRQHRVPILTTKQFQSDPKTPYIHVSIGVLQASDQGSVAYVVDVSLHQKASLIHKLVDVDIHAHTTTWRVPFTYGIGGINSVKKAVTELLDEKIDAFSNDYLKANSP